MQHFQERVRGDQQVRRDALQHVGAGVVGDDGLRQVVAFGQAGAPASFHHSTPRKTGKQARQE